MKRALDSQQDRDEKFFEQIEPMATIEIYDKPMCCSTGICGPEVAPVLPRFAADLDWLRSTGHVVARFNLAHQPAAFADNVTVRKVLSDDGVDCLPLVIVNGQIVSRAVYPSRGQLVAWAGTTVGLAAQETDALPIVKPSSGCCSNSGHCSNSGSCGNSKCS